ncbi:hypothetical protein [Vibrio breoganii]|uniref:hypothetical protein n=1 Tax=Vibrio breoganii TaxID=553239 RepID=UPI000C850412|nr:hypothetical protein [Vibrio breoganii]PML91865.1 hypothetical protein BCT64_17305 [Vibrio breoganii]PMN57892.1 hypothetical protein BCT28_15125 [Vibrio breoganii]
MKTVFKLAVIASSVLLAACGGSDSDNSPSLNDFDVDFQSFNYVSTGVSLEAEYSVEPFSQEVTLFDGSVYGVVTNESLLIQYEGAELPSYKVEVALKDANTDTVLDEQDLNVSSSSDDKLVFAVGDLNNAVDDPPRLIIFDEPDDEVPDGKVALYVMNLRDTSSTASTYSISIDGTQVQSGLTQGALSSVIEVAESADVLITVTDNNTSQDCTITNFDWSVDDEWIVVFDKASLNQCYEPKAID